jgi:mannose-1-phosphate guanylyltransferase / mannose-6-phosphate isomerase
MQIIPIILSGGSGSRLWPLSRKQYPKQYLQLAGTKTMLQETILRLGNSKVFTNPIIVCNEDHRFLVAEQCKEINVGNPTILLEPVGRNTAPAIAAAAIHSLTNNQPSVLLVLSADHIIKDLNAFHNAIEVAYLKANEGKLVTFGIVPSDAKTGYGYIKIKAIDKDDTYSVEEFIEKPNLETAESFLKNGDYFWNSGMFMFQADEFIKEIINYSPTIYDAVKKSLDNASLDLDFIRLEKSAFSSSPSDSIDYAVMEKSDNLVVVPLDADWSDIGSWSALYDTCKKDKNGNAIEGDVLAIQTTNTYINAKHHMVATIGVEDLIVVDTPDATFISSQKMAHEVKSVVSQLKNNNRNEYSDHRKVYRPWGWFDSIETGQYFQVKRLHVNPGAKLSLQTHKKRAEHWVVVIGIATATIGTQVHTLKKGESTYIPIGVLHKLENNTKDPLEVIEVQSGIYLGEDDITRFEDIYGRIKT